MPCIPEKFQDISEVTDFGQTTREQLDACLAKIDEIEARMARTASEAERNSFSLRLAFLRDMESWLRSRDEG